MLRVASHWAALLTIPPATLGAQARHAFAAPRTPLFRDLGTLRHPIQTSSPITQHYFDQGLRLVYAFNHQEAISSFKEALRHDSTCAMCYWGIALALGPNINASMGSSQVRPAWDATQMALKLSAGAGGKERVYIEALATRYASGPVASRGRLDSLYAHNMRELWRRYPSDLDASVLFAEAMLDLRPWDQWTTGGRPQPGTLETVLALERVLKQDPDHPGACHYYIHAVEASPNPERALPCARTLPTLMPGAGHLVHMPAHLYLRLGRYAEAIESSIHASHADERYLEDRHPTGDYPQYYAHNLHFLWAASAMAGRSRGALDAARKIAAQTPPELLRRAPGLEFAPPTPWLALVRFGRWREMLVEPAPLPEFRYVTAMWYHARGLALLRTGRMAEALAARDSVAVIAAATPKARRMGVNAAGLLLDIAAKSLSGEIAAEGKEFARAIETLEQAVRLQDGLAYSEPPSFYYPVRHSLGVVLLSAGRADAAEAVYREDLRRNPENGWSLSGLERALLAEKRNADAAAVARRLEAAWAGADVKLTGSRF